MLHLDLTDIISPRKSQDMPEEPKITKLRSIVSEIWTV